MKSISQTPFGPGHTADGQLDPYGLGQYHDGAWQPLALWYTVVSVAALSADVAGLEDRLDGEPIGGGQKFSNPTSTPIARPWFLTSDWIVITAYQIASRIFTPLILNLVWAGVDSVTGPIDQLVRTTWGK